MTFLVTTLKARLPLLGLLAFKVNWLLLVVGQSRWLLEASLLTALQVAAVVVPTAPVPRGTVLMRCVLITLAGIGVDQTLLSTGLLQFEQRWLPAWLALLWFSFALTLPYLDRWLATLPRWATVATGSIGGVLSYRAGVAVDAVQFGEPAWLCMALLALWWALVLPLWLVLTRLPKPAVPPAAAFTMVTLLALGTAATPSPVHAQPSQPEWQLVGEGDFSVLFFDLYHARLDAASKPFTFPGTAPFRLTLTYARNIKAEQIIEHTEKQWRNQGVAYPATWPQWLRDCLPPIQEGDRLSLVVLPTWQSELYHNDRLLAHFDNRDFTEAFAGIWLSERTSAPDFRQRLLGLP